MESYVYERHNGRIYARKFGGDPSMRVDVTDDFDNDITPNSLINEMKENQLWRDIRETAKDNPALQSALDNVKILYYMSKQNVSKT